MAAPVVAAVVFGAKRLGAEVAAVDAGAPAAVVVVGLNPEKREVAAGAALEAGVASVVAVAGLNPEKRDGAAGAALEAAVASVVVVAGLNPEKRDGVAGAALEAAVAVVPAAVLSPVIFPPSLKMEPVVVGAAAGAAVGTAVALEVGKTPNKGFGCVAPAVDVAVAGTAPALEAAGVEPKIPPVLVVFCPPKIFPALGCGAAVVAVVTVVLGAPKRFPVVPPSLVPPNTFAVVFESLEAIGVPAGVVEEAKLNMLPVGLLSAGVVLPNKLPDAAGALSVLLRVGNKLPVDVEAADF